MKARITRWTSEHQTLIALLAGIYLGLCLWVG